MPTYEFRCPDGTIIERVFKISEVPAEIPAPNGDGVAVRIISGGAGLLFKGTGFYITDYGKDGKKDQRASSGEKSSSGSAESSTSGSSSADAKPAASSAPAPKSEPKSD
jgi:predicted nucleic acid-binding Zn ribbon protein